MYSWCWVRLSPETCRVKPLRRIKTHLLHLVGLISLLQYFFVLYPVQYLVSQPYFWHNFLFANNNALVNSITPPLRLMYTQLWPSGESLTNYMTLLCAEFDQPWPIPWLHRHCAYVFKWWDWNELRFFVTAFQDVVVTGFTLPSTSFSFVEVRKESEVCEVGRCRGECESHA